MSFSMTYCVVYGGQSDMRDLGQALSVPPYIVTCDTGLPQFGGAGDPLSVHLGRSFTAFSGNERGVCSGPSIIILTVENG